MATSTSEAATIVDRWAHAFVGLMRLGPDPHKRIVGSAWTIAELAAHMASGTEAYATIAEGQPSPYTDLDERAQTNAALLATRADTDLSAMADVVLAETARAVRALLAMPPGLSVSWHAGIPMPVGAVLGAMAGEFMFHGLDLARTLGVRWPIPRAEAGPVIDFFLAVTPHVLDRAALRDGTTTYEVRFRRYGWSTFALYDGALVVSPGRATKPDVRMSVDPVGFLAVGYGRSGLAKLVVTGRALAWGRRPWLAFGFPRLFEAP